MSDRLIHSQNFLTSNGWGDAIRTPLADDASFRRYERLTLPDYRPQNDHRPSSAILMDAPPCFEDISPFMAVANYLRDLGLAAPEILSHDEKNGFLILEDMGDNLFARVIEKSPEREKELYQLAVEGLVHLHSDSPPAELSVKDQNSHKLPRYNLNLLLQELGLFVDWYLASHRGKPLPEKDRLNYMKAWEKVLTNVSTDLNCLVLRDYHTENLMLRSDRAGLARLGLLDFQDAVIGHKAYDLVSLLQDARRDVPLELEQEMLDYYMSQNTCHKEEFRRDYAILGAQRNTKIIGIFTRLFLRDGKSAYLDKIPRVWKLLERDLAHPALLPVKEWLEDHIAKDVRIAPFMPRPFMAERAMILAAGFGSRMRPLTESCPKPLIPVAGKELLSYSLEGLCAAGIRNIVVNMHYLADQIETYVEGHYDHRLTLTLSDERQQIMDSGGGVKKALPTLGDEPFFVLNSDMIWRDTDYMMLHRMQATWQPDNMDILMLLVRREKAFGFEGAGDYHQDDQGRLTARGSDNEADFVYGGVLLMKPDCFQGETENVFSLRRQFDQAAAAGRLYGIIHDGDWYHVGTVEAKTELEALFGEAEV